eukprot:CAMPEP_0172424548 /NCGR_PEP_ID=MMETSP1064-20121228/26269_1 /TAXON_ID=202472 /ORGANISM="Aulacoseira subarctica , Strain CCAP 1002/5" /LENGTH=521 /DNA_ID=CAMNT_0013166739 /DNA_START=74 /DNA_END=1639 /DNA_ORIENTATION=+
MKLCTSSLILAVLAAHQAVYAAPSNCTTSSWTIGGIIPLDSTTCNLATVTAALGSCFTTVYPGNAAEAVQKLCASMEVPFGSIASTPINFQQDKNYMDGQTLLNYGNQSKVSENIAVFGGQMGRFLSTKAASTRLAWPTYQAVSASGYDSTGYMSNFHLNNSCASRVAMCCFTGTLSPATQSIPRNADACVHDISASKNSSHVRRGSTRFNITGNDAYCVGFSWSSDPNSVSNKYKANALSAISYAQTYTLGYSGNLPSAPMCGCVEQMPIVTKADCVSVDAATETGVNLIYQGNTSAMPLTAKLLTSVTYGNCNGNDLKTFYSTMSTVAEQTALATRIVESCDSSTAKFMNNRYWISGSKPAPVDPSKWKNVAGKGTLYFPSIGDSAFRSLSLTLRSDGRYPVVYRKCAQCSSVDYRDIYYQRKTPYPTNLDYLNNFLSNWTSVSNLIGIDFDLYGSYSDAISNKNAWTICNYDDPSGAIGFPRDCGKTALVAGYWNTWAIGASNSVTDPGVAFFVEVST